MVVKTQTERQTNNNDPRAHSSTHTRTTRTLTDLRTRNYHVELENAVLKKLKAVVDQQTEKDKRQ